ncbi:MAG: DegT/DnrJ/EryC1/StrS family aminotransferase, partial [Bacteroidota bacterium]
AHVHEIKKICDRNKLFLIEDCAQSHFSSENDVLAGRLGIASTFSFYPGKNLGAYGDAGCIMTDNDELATNCRMFANHGAIKKHDHRMEGINSRLDTLQAAILTVKADHILKWTESRISRAAVYNEALKQVEQVSIPSVRTGTKHTFHLYVIRAKKRDELKEFLESNGIQTAIHYPTALPNLPAYRYLNHQPAEFPVATRYQSEILSLPMYPELTDDQIAYVVAKVKEFFEH